jgi:hypothetical protein
MSSLPILWAEAPDIGNMLGNSSAPPHWARGVLEARGKLYPLDRIANETMRGVDIAVLAQPRALSPEEMVALDRWVRGGGKLLLFADPMLTAPSIYPIGDKRRPQAIAMVDPLLVHWGLELHFDEAAAMGVGTIQSDGLAIPVNLPGELRLTGNQCSTDKAGLVARCRIGLGQAVIIADTSLLETGQEVAEKSRISMLEELLNLVDKAQ